jgi:putative ABC transport system permease protein
VPESYPGLRFAPRALLIIARRYLFGHPWQSGLMILGIALGVAVVVAVDLANESSRAAFEIGAEAVAGRTTHQIVGAAGRLEESIYIELRSAGLIENAAPVIIDYFSSPRLGDRPLQLLGIDPFADFPFRPYLGGARQPPLENLTTFLTHPGSLLISRQMAERYDVNVGDELPLLIDGRQQTAIIAGLIEPADDLTRRSLDGMLIADIATAQELLGRTGYLDHIDLLISDSDLEDLEKLEAWLPENARIVTAAARRGSVEEMTAAFRLNLSALSLLALLVGVFLIYNTMTFSVIQRRPMFGVLRCLGVTRAEVFLMVMAEALLVGIIGSFLGTLLGLLMAQNSIRLVLQTINDLYFTTTVSAAALPTASFIKGALLGVLASCLTAAVPSWEAAAVQPRVALLRSGLERRSRRAVFWVSLAGVVFILLGVVAFFCLPHRLFYGFAGAFFVIGGFAMTTPIIMVALMALFRPALVAGFGLLGRMAPRNLVGSLSRTSVTVAALMIAVAVMIGVNLMIDSFRYTVDIWLEEILHGDIYISAPSFIASAPSTTLGEGVLDAVERWPGVNHVDLLRSTTIESPQGPVKVSAVRNPNIGRERFYLQLSVDPDEVWAALENGGILISEPLAHRFDLFAPGSKIELFTSTGLREFPVTGIFYDYASSEGSLLIGMDVYRNLWQDSSLTALDIFLDPGYDTDEVALQMQDGLDSDQQLIIRPNRALRQDVMEVFDRTFAITISLRLLTTVVAFVGVLNTLLLLQFEKQREIGILRALGLTTRQLWQLVMLETGLMGLVSGLLAIPAGYTLALILVYIINQRSFGWTLQLLITPDAFVQALLLSVGAALLAGVLPARQMSRLAAAAAIRYE